MENKPTGLISFTGPMIVGGTLTSISTLADADGLSTFRYQWMLNGKPFDGAIEKSLLIDDTLIGKKISLEVTYTDLAGNQEQVSSNINYIQTSYELSQPSLWISSNVLIFEGQHYIKDNPLLVMQTAQIDLNGDGLEDIITYDSYSLDIPTPNPPPSIFINNGKEMIKTPWSGPLMMDPHGVKILTGDFNGDGYPDIFSLTATDLPNGQFPNLQDITSIIYTGTQIKLTEFNQFKGFWIAGASGDINNDGSLDIIMFNFHVGTNGVQNQILWNDGKGNFRFDTSGIGNIQTDQAELYDINHNGYLDLIIDRLDTQGRHVSILWGNGLNYTLDRSINFDLPRTFFPSNLCFANLTNSQNDNIILSGVDDKGFYWIRIFDYDENVKNYIDISDQIIDNNSTTSRFDHIKVEDLDGNGLTDIFSPDMADNIRWQWNGNKFVRLNDPVPSDNIWQITKNNPVVQSQITICGTDSNDNLMGSNSTFWGGAGNDTLVGVSGISTSIYSGPSKDYVITINLSSTLVSDDIPARDGKDTLSGIQYLQFSDGLKFDITSFTKTATLAHNSIVGLVELYIASFNRAPDSVGLDYWGGRLSDGMLLQDIAKSFFVQPETVAAYPSNIPTSDFVTKVYNNVLSRGPDSAGLNYWVGELNNGHVTKDSFLLAIINGAMAPTGSSVDRQTLANKEVVGEHYAIYQGLNNSTTWAKDVMSEVNDQINTVSAANTKADGYAAIAANLFTSDLMVKLVGIGI
jgi:Domain of unknown function (DUF4214)/FG-GAP-like repeat